MDEEVELAEQAIKEISAAATASWAPKVVGTNEMPLDRPLPSTFGPEPAQPPRGGQPIRDWSSALDLIREATDAIAISEQRAVDLEFALRQATDNAAEEARQLNAKLAAADRRAQKAEERARSAEARATEAETWLGRIHDAVLAGFKKRLSPSEGEPTGLEPAEPASTKP